MKLSLIQIYKKHRAAKRFKETSDNVCAAFGHITFKNGSMYDQNGQPNRCSCPGRA